MKCSRITKLNVNSNTFIFTHLIIIIIEQKTEIKDIFLHIFLLKHLNIYRNGESTVSTAEWFTESVLSDSLNQFWVIHWISFEWFTESVLSDSLNPFWVIHWIRFEWFTESVLSDSSNPFWVIHRIRFEWFTESVLSDSLNPFWVIHWIRFEWFTESVLSDSSNPFWVIHRIRFRLIHWNGHFEQYILILHCIISIYCIINL